MRSLKTIQSLAKVGRVLSSIVFICCIVAFCISLVGLVMGDTALKAGSVTIQGVIDLDELEEYLTPSVMRAVMGMALVSIFAEAIVAKFAEIYFKHEIADGTPFTLRGANELMRLGILVIVLPLAASIVCTILSAAIPGGEDAPILDDYTSIGLGVMMIIMSLFCKYGTALREKAEQTLTEI